MKIGTIDIGTNSMRLLIADYKNNKIENRKKYINITRIGQGVDDKGYITEEALERNLNALKEFADKCIEEKCEKVYCMGTSALRDSKNGQDFVNRAKELSNHELIIIKNINDEVSQEEVENEIQSIEADDGKININTADINKLKEIPGIGDVKANSIIIYRESNGNFKSIEDLKNVDGIGEKTFEKIKNNIKI